MSWYDLSFSIVKDVLLAGQINRDGEGFKADLLGMGVNLDIPGFQFVELDAYARKDNFNKLTWQITLAWDLPFGHYPVSLTGYVDINGTDNNGTEINAQPQLLIDGVDGVRVYQKHPQDIVAVLMDMTMPKMDGKTCFTELRRINKHIKVVLSSGYNEQEATSRFAGQGLAGFIQKLYSPDTLSEKMQQIVKI